MKYCPDACPECGFVWYSYQGRNYGRGFEQLAAGIWKCTRRDHRVKSSSTKEKRVARF
ncbi:hypothetical protein [Halobacterium zhouii]|uniref:hypothetical protein n=1 Tax=Halobacterium zhouii TaxID=2902624 RepID=UPI003D7A9049